MKHIIIYDTEFWTDKGVQSRGWRGLDDHPPFVTQIGAFKVRLDKDLTIVDEHISYIKPLSWEGREVPVTPFMTELTNITQDDIDTKGVSIEQGMKDFEAFVDGNTTLSYGLDVISTLLPSCFVAGIDCPLKNENSSDVRQVFRRGGVSEDIIYTHSSGQIATALGVEMDAGHFVHDARCDAFSILEAMRALVKKGNLKLEDIY